jgi:uncharacterized membrane protein YeaQ/YmgE (transglycosylase-associated protein family)
MDLIVYLLVLFVIGLIVGALARLIVPGPTTLGLFATSLCGIVGSFLAGLVAYYLFTPHSALLGFVLAVICAAVLVAIFGRPRGRTIY